MRQEDKEVDGRDLERAERLEGSELEAKNEDKLPAPALDQVHDLARMQRADLLAAVQAIFTRDHIVVDTLRLPQHELRALEALKAAVDGRDAQLAQFVYAKDRSKLLEQALAVLQPNLDLADREYARLVDEVRALRDRLHKLSEAQDELEGGHGEHTKTATQADEQADGDVAAASSGDAEREPAQKPAPSTLYGPERVAAKTEPSTLYGAELPARLPAPSTLSDPDGAEPRASKAATPSTLGDANEIAAAQQDPVRKAKPWWKRPFG